MSPRAVVSVSFSVALLIAGCGGGTSPTSLSLPGDASLAELVFCADETNRYRALARVPALTRSTEIEAFAAAAAASDSQTKVPHGYYSSHGPGAGAENEVIDWSSQTFGSVRGVMQQAIAAFWNEGPGGGHYRNLTGAYTRVGCGAKLTGGLVTFVQDFR